MSKNKNKVCWWCGKKADSREHKYKRTDYLHAFNEEDNAVLPLKNGKLLPIQSAKSDYLKFDYSLCKRCNNERSQKIDNAYSVFVNYALTNTPELINKKYLDFGEIYGDHWYEMKQNLIRYYAKHLGCRLAFKNIDIPNKLIDFLNGENVLDSIKLEFQIRTDFYHILNNTDWTGNLFMGDLTLVPFNYDGKFIGRAFHTLYSVQWLRTIIWLAKDTKLVKKFLDLNTNLNKIEQLSLEEILSKEQMEKMEYNDLIKHLFNKSKKET